MQIMAILNITPDSFSDGGLYCDPVSALSGALRLYEAGADIIDVGAESTAPAASPVSAECELSRLSGILPRLIQKVPLPFSVDTYKTEVAKYALDQGAEIINDVSGFSLSGDMMEFIVSHKPYYICGHIYGNSLHDASGEHSVGKILDYFRYKSRALTDRGFPPDRLILDPGFGFGKTAKENIALFRNIDAVKALGFRVCCGVSRKRFIRDICGDSPAGSLGGSLAAAVLLSAKDVDIIRVHDAEETVAAVRFAEFIRKDI